MKSLSFVYLHCRDVVGVATVGPRSTVEGDPADKALHAPHEGLDGAQGKEHRAILLVGPVVTPLCDPRVEAGIVLFAPVLVADDVEHAALAERVRVNAESEGPSGEMATAETAVDEGADQTRVEPKCAHCHHNEVESLQDEHSSVEGEGNRPLRSQVALLLVFLAVRGRFSKDLPRLGWVEIRRLFRPWRQTLVICGSFLPS
mmetsp:Transcript_16267/g.20609  ORF Transcript_16267/g.20609 Transcript_16267/m.20609 type:complete len:202 (-) Transcript_16267:249-854(-)